MKNGVILLALLLALLLAAMAMVPMVNADAKQITNGDNYQLPHLQFDNTQSRIIIHNGFSLSEDNNLTVIPEGSIIQHSSEGITRVFDPNGKQLSISNDLDSPKLPTPNGYISAERINQIPNGAFVQENDNGTTNVYLNDQRILTVLTPADKMRPIPSTTGWIEESYAWGIPQMSQFIADWTVPSSPPNPYTNAKNYIFNGIEPSTGLGIVQPVLEYNYASNNLWSGAAWYVDSNNVGYRGSGISTNVGDMVRGTLTWNTNVNRWNVIFQDLTTGGSSSIISTNAPNIGSSNLGAFCALEGYYISNNNDVSGKIIFRNMQFKNANNNPISFSWNQYTNPGMPLTNLDVTWSGMTPVTLKTKNN